MQTLTAILILFTFFLIIFLGIKYFANWFKAEKNLVYFRGIKQTQLTGKEYLKKNGI